MWVLVFHCVWDRILLSLWEWWDHRHMCSVLRECRGSEPRPPPLCDKCIICWPISEALFFFLFIIAILKFLLENSDASTAGNNICWLSVIDECKRFLDVDEWLRKEPWAFSHCWTLDDTKNFWFDWHFLIFLHWVTRAYYCWRGAGPLASSPEVPWASLLFITLLISSYPLEERS